MHGSGPNSFEEHTDIVCERASLQKKNYNFVGVEPKGKPGLLKKLGVLYTIVDINFFYM